MNPEERREAVFGAFDGVVSTVGFVFGLLVHKSPSAAIAIGGLGGAISATVSMGTGAFESAEGAWHQRARDATAMGIATLIGSAMPIWPWFVRWPRTEALIASAIGCLFVAGWIGSAKARMLRESGKRRPAAKGYLSAYTTLLGAVALSLAIVSVIPASVG